MCGQHWGRLTTNSGSEMDAAGPSAAPTLLLVDHCRQSRASIRELVGSDYQIQTASSGQEALYMAQLQPPNVVLMEIGLPGDNGIEICRRMGESEKTANIPVVLMSADIEDDIHELAFRNGAADLVAKPVRRSELRARLSQQLTLSRKARQSRRLALYDMLTQLPNRSLSVDRLRQALLQDRRDRLHTALLFVDLDHFKTINDSLGHEAGDELLEKAARRLEGQVRRGDTVGRWGGDEFVIVLRSLLTPDAAEAVAESVLRAFQQPFLLGGLTKRVGVSIGVAMAPADAQDESSLIARADTAMYKAKQYGRSCIKFYQEAMNLDLERHVQLERHLHDALRCEELWLEYQPLVDLSSGDVVAAEALLRWDSTALGAVDPAEFIELAEHCGLIWEIGEFALRRACAELADLVGTDGRPLRLTVNVSTQQIRQAAFPGLVQDILRDSGMAANRLDIDVTEKLAMENSELALKNLNILRETGVRLVMDDFGTGLTALSHLESYPFDALKIDNRLIRDMAGVNEQLLVQGLIALARAMRLSVIAEGVETPDQLERLREQCCTLAQGNYICPPVPAFQLRQALTGHGRKEAGAADAGSRGLDDIWRAHSAIPVEPGT